MISWYLAISVVAILCADLARRYYNFRHHLNRKNVVLELTPPAFARKSPRATEHLFTVLHTIGLSRSFRERLLGRTSSFSFEVLSTRSGGIQYLVRLAAQDIPVFEQQLAAYMPDVQFKEIPDYVDAVLNAGIPVNIMEFKQARHFAFPLATHDSLTKHDPIAYITGSMTKLLPDELIAYQMVISSVSPREVSRIRNKLILGKDPDLYRKSRPLWLKVFIFILGIPIHVLRFVLGMLTEMTRPTYQYPKKAYYQQLATAPVTHTPEHQAFLTTLHEKLSQSLYQTSIRAIIVTKNDMHAQQSGMGISAALASFAVPGYQGLIAKRRFPNKILYPYRLYGFKHRLPAPLMKHASVLAVSEVASLYHFPYGDTARPENMVASHSRTLPASFSLKHSADNGNFDVIFGQNKHHGSNTAIGLTTAERERHMYIVGGTGNGKTTLLEYAIIQDIQNGKGLAVIDPHGDLAQDVLRHVPKERMKDVIYFNPYDLGHPIGLNLLELPEGLDPDELARHQDFLTEAIVSIFRKIFSEDDSGGHRIESVLRNTIHTAFTVPDATLFTLYDLLTDPDFRKKIVGKLKDKRLKNFWNNEFGRAGSFQQVKMASGITNKIGRFDRSESARRVIEQTKSTIDFDDIINSGKILICNFAKGDIGEDTSELFGIAVLAKLQLAAQHRSQMAPRDRRSFYLYVDEFQNFATMSFVQLLAEARKYKLFLIMAEQSVAQQKEQRIVSIILDNVGTVVCFRAASPSSEKVLLPIFEPYIDKGEIANLPAYNFYMSIRAVQTQEPMSGETVVLEDEGSQSIADEVIAESRENYTTKYEAKEMIVEENVEDDPTPEAGTGLADDPVSG